MWNPPQFRLENRVPALLYWESDIDMRRESAGLKNYRVDVLGSIRSTDNDGRSIVRDEMDEQFAGDLPVFGVRPQRRRRDRRRGVRPRRGR